MDYYRIVTDPDAVAGWFPAEPTSRDGVEVDARTFTRCQEYRGEPLVLATVQEGKLAPITLGPFEMPVVSGAVGRKLMNVAPVDVQLVPVGINRVEAVILNVLRCVDCIDEERTLGEKWRDSDGRPDRIGRYRTIVRLFIDPKRTCGAQVLRIDGWRSPLIVSNTVIDALGGENLVGTKLIPVT